jgi:hypothetical protein
MNDCKILEINILQTVIFQVTQQFAVFSRIVTKIMTDIHISGRCGSNTFRRVNLTFKSLLGTFVRFRAPS